MYEEGDGERTAGIKYSTGDRRSQSQGFVRCIKYLGDTGGCGHWLHARYDTSSFWSFYEHLIIQWGAELSVSW